MALICAGDLATALTTLIPPGTEVLARLELGGVPTATALSVAAGIRAVFVAAPLTERLRASSEPRWTRPTPGAAWGFADSSFGYWLPTIVPSEPRGSLPTCVEVDVVNEDKLSSVLSEFARTMITDFPIQRILDQLVHRIVEVLPITSAGVTLISTGSNPHYIAASDASARRFERLQTDIDEGPCIEAFRFGHSVSLPDLRADDRFPLFSPAGVAAGLAAVFTFPLCHGVERFGALDLYRETPGELEPDDMVAAQTLADVAAALLLNAKAREEALATSNRFHFNAMHDPLTGLPNRLLLHERLEHAALRSQRAHTCTAVLFLDLDRFKNVNDTHGHLIGDELLRVVAQRLSGLVRAGDTLARFSGDEFVFLCEELHSVDEVAILVGRIDETFAEPFDLDGVSVTVGASVGTAYGGPGEAITSDLLMRADLDMYRAKREGVGAEIIEISSVRLSADDRSLEDDMRDALATGEFEIAYQPIVHVPDGLITGVEALLRWTHPHRGPIPPLLMVSVAERSELISDLGAWVLERACEDHAHCMTTAANRPIELAVNVSVRQMMSPDFCANVSAVLERTGMDSRLLVLELTESIAMEHSARIMQVLVGLNDLGVRLALDDFGTGYSSLSYLSRLPIQIVKIDRGFIAELGQASGRIVVAAVTGMAHDLGLTVVAEGVETETQRDQTIAAGCDYAQGFFYAQPMPAKNIEELLATQSVRPAAAQHPPAGRLPVGGTNSLASEVAKGSASRREPLRNVGRSTDGLGEREGGDTALYAQPDRRADHEDSAAMIRR